MKSLIRSIGIAVGLITLAGVQNASAQVTDAIEFTTSFAFTAGSATLPAGTYTIRPDEDAPDILLLTGAQGSVFLPTDNAQAREVPSKTEVVFARYGGGYVLKNIWVAGSTSGAVSKTAEGERHMAKLGGSKGEQRVAALKVDLSKGR
jgi:hypothetical protein